MRLFTKVEPERWTSSPFCLCTDEERLLFMYYLSGPHQNMWGVARIPDAYVADDLGWDASKCASIRKGLIDKGLICYDADTAEVWIVDWCRDNGPQNGSHLVGALKGLARVQSPTLSALATQNWEEALPPKQKTQQGSPQDGVDLKLAALRNKLAKQ